MSITVPTSPAFTLNKLRPIYDSQLIYSAVARPQGRGKIERLFRTINTELLPEVPGNLCDGKPASPPRLSLAELDEAIGTFIVSTYNARVHSAIGVTPVDAWRGDGWLPRMPDSLEALDTLLVMVAKPRVVHRDGIHLRGCGSLTRRSPPMWASP